MNPVAVAPVAVNGIRLAAAAGGTSIALEVVGASAAVASASTFILATAGAGAVLLVGFGIFKALTKD